MKLRDFPLFADENMMRKMVESLRQDGFDVKYVRETGMIGWKDIDLMPVAFSEGRVILTQDNDFGKIIFPPKNISPRGRLFLR